MKIMVQPRAATVECTSTQPAVVNLLRKMR
jgi:hypothetical protein